MADIKAFIFDLDGVIVFTDKFHYLAWKQMADSMGIYFDEEINHRLRGVSRMDSLEIILERYEGEPLSDERKQELCSYKNGIYREYLATMTPDDVDPEVRRALDEVILVACCPLLHFGSSDTLQKVPLHTHALFLQP